MSVIVTVTGLIGSEYWAPVDDAERRIVGASLTALTVIETAAVFESMLPSFALKVKLSGPL
jgi:hypothetical protein